MSDKGTFFIGELAARTGVSRDTIRYYESAGVLPEPDRSDSGYRVYGREDVERLDFVGQAQTLGLTLEQIAEVLEMVEDGREPCVHVRRSLQARLEETRTRIAELRSLETRLERALSRTDYRVSRDMDACRCRIIEGTAAGAGDGGS